MKKEFIKIADMAIETLKGLPADDSTDLIKFSLNYKPWMKTSNGHLISEITSAKATIETEIDKMIHCFNALSPSTKHDIREYHALEWLQLMIYGTK